MNLELNTAEAASLLDFLTGKYLTGEKELLDGDLKNIDDIIKRLEDIFEKS